MSWFDVAESADGRSYSVWTRRTGAVTPFRPGVPRTPIGWFDIPPIVGFGSIVNTLIFRRTWIVIVEPSDRSRGMRWKVQLPNEEQAVRRAVALAERINAHQWDPQVEPPP